MRRRHATHTAGHPRELNLWVSNWHEGGGAEDENGLTPLMRRIFEDVGYDLLVTSSNAEFRDRCAPSGHPAWLRGRWVLPSVGTFEMGERKFVSILDGFGKLHEFAFGAGEVCATYRTMRTGFYNESLEAGEIGPRPARKCLGKVSEMSRKCLVTPARGAAHTSHARPTKLEPPPRRGSSASRGTYLRRVA